jgi:hypothetical protein
MYIKQVHLPISAENFELTAEGKLSADNRWVKQFWILDWGLVRLGRGGVGEKRLTYSLLI